MKKQAVLFAFVSAYLFVCLLAGCCNVKCQTDKKLPEQVLELFPFQQGSQVQFMSNSGDTVIFTCIEKIFSQSLKYEDEQPQQECCDGYKVENVSWLLKANEEDTMYIRTDSDFYLSLYCSIKIDTFIEGGLFLYQFTIPAVDKLDSIQLAGKIFYDVYPTYNGKIYLDPTLGIVGFILGNKEWRVL